MSERGPSASVLRCPSCRAAVDASLVTCPFCGTRVVPPDVPDEPPPEEEPGAVEEAVEEIIEKAFEEPVEPTEAPAPAQAAPVPEKPSRGPGLGTRIAVLVAGLGLLAAVALVQRLAEPDRPVATTQRETPAPSSEPVVEPPPTPSVEPQAVSTTRACPSRIERDVDRHYSFERSRLGLWFRRLERYNDHDLRIDGNRSAHAVRDARIDASRSSRLGALESKRADAGRSCDPRLLV